METAKLARILKALSHEKRLELFLEVDRQDGRNFEDEKEDRKKH